MADPLLWMYVMTCCGMFTAWQPPKLAGAWSGNESHEVETCPNPHCHTRRTNG